MAAHRVRLSGGNDWGVGLRSRAVGAPVLSAREVALVMRDLNEVLRGLDAAVARYDSSAVDELTTLAWQRAAEVPQHTTRRQRAELITHRRSVDASAWREKARTFRPVPTPGRVAPGTTSHHRLEPPRPAEPAPPEMGPLLELATRLRPIPTRVAHRGSLTTWARLSEEARLPRLRRDDRGTLLWLVDDDREVPDEPLLCALVTVGDRQMDPLYPFVAEHLGRPADATVTRQRAAWALKVLKVHQHWRHRRA
ncbi:hypothetical protein [Embleya sp. NPDC050493]|uniref:hypothetical protein n=1 Tax=Embleya sp. NPDC050493 TaxID=3363989 RepID=UPI0037B7533C